MLDASGAFGRKAVTDKYGRKVKHEIKEDLSKFYDIEDDVDAGNSQAQKMIHKHVIKAQSEWTEGHTMENATARRTKASSKTNWHRQGGYPG